MPRFDGGNFFELLNILVDGLLLGTRRSLVGDLYFVITRTFLFHLLKWL